MPEFIKSYDGSIHDSELIIKNVFSNNTSYCLISVNSQNYRYWVQEKPRCILIDLPAKDVLAENVGNKTLCSFLNEVSLNIAQNLLLP